MATQKAPTTKSAGSTAKKKSTVKKTTAAKPIAKTRVSTKPQARWIRNLRNHPVHLRLRNPEAERPFFLQLTARGGVGDAERVPANVAESREFIEAVQSGVVEIVTLTELNKIDYPAVGYLHSPATQIVRPSDRDLTTVPDWDGKGRAPRHEAVIQRPLGDRFNAAPDVTSMAGGDAKMKVVGEDRKAGAADMIPDGIDLESRKVTVERIR